MALKRYILNQSETITYFNGDKVYFAPAKSYFDNKQGGVFQICYNGKPERIVQSGDIERTQELIRNERKAKGDNLNLLDFKILYTDNDIQQVFNDCQLDNEFRKDLIREAFVKNLVYPHAYEYHSRSIDFEDARKILPKIEQAVSDYCTIKKIDF